MLVNDSTVVCTYWGRSGGAHKIPEREGGLERHVLHVGYREAIVDLGQ